MNLGARLAKLETESAQSKCHVVEINGWLEGDAADASVDEALNARGIVPKPNDLVIALRRFGGVQ